MTNIKRALAAAALLGATLMLSAPAHAADPHPGGTQGTGGGFPGQLSPFPDQSGMTGSDQSGLNGPGQSGLSGDFMGPSGLDTMNSPMNPTMPPAFG